MSQLRPRTVGKSVSPEYEWISKKKFIERFHVSLRTLNRMVAEGRVLAQKPRFFTRIAIDKDGKFVEAGPAKSTAGGPRKSKLIEEGKKNGGG